MSMYAAGFSVDYDRLDAKPIGGGGKKCGGGFISRNKECRMTKGSVKAGAFGKKSNKEIRQLEKEFAKKPRNKDGSAKISAQQAGGLMLTRGTATNRAAKRAFVQMRGKDLKNTIKKFEKSSNPAEFALGQLAKRERFNRRASIGLSLGIMGAGAAASLMQPKS